MQGPRYGRSNGACGLGLVKGKNLSFLYFKRKVLLQVLKKFNEVSASDFRAIFKPLISNNMATHFARQGQKL